MVGAGVFNKEQTERTMDSVWPNGIKRIKSKVVAFEPDNSLVTITSGEKISYKLLWLQRDLSWTGKQLRV